MPSLKFVENTADEGEGLSDAGIETYRDDPFPAVARETVQNSRDAHDESSNPVRIDFDHISVAREDFPDLEGFLEATRCCLEGARTDDNQKEMAFFEQALSVLEQEEIPILKIADYNTTGLCGPCTSSPPTPFYALVKSSGSSVKDNQSAGGSFGIGKSAVYSASDLQTVLYSTIYTCKETNKPKFLCQSKTKFRSHTSNEGDSYRSTGYWGDSEKFMPIESAKAVPEWARREKTGTTVFSLGVRNADDWKSRLICSIIINFYGAINAGNMELSVDGTIINKSTLLSLLEDENISKHTPSPEDFYYATLALECINNPSKTEIIDIEGVGQFRLDLMIRNGLPKKVIILRNGMVICSELSHFGDKFSRFQLHKDFIAVIEPVEPDGDDMLNSSEWMRRLENPRHDELSPERLPKESDRSSARTQGTRLARSVRDFIKSEAKKPAGHSTALDELSKFFADEAPREEDIQGQRGIQTTKITRISSTRKVASPTPIKDGDEEGEQGGSADQNGEGGSEGKSKGQGSGEGDGGEGSSKSEQPFKISAIRTLFTDSSSPSHRKVFFTPLESGSASLRFQAAGVSDSEEIKFANGEDIININCLKDQRISLDVEFNNSYSGPIEIVATTQNKNLD